MRRVRFWLYLLILGIVAIISPERILAIVIQGTDGHDDLQGTNDKDTIFGRAGNDIIMGLGANDNIQGNLGNDTILDDEGDDMLQGHDGNDVIAGGVGNDKISGGNGNDILLQNYGFNIPDDSKDKISCGSGLDWAIIRPQEGDSASADCEIVTTVHP